MLAFAKWEERFPLDSDREMEQGTANRAKMSNKQCTEAKMQ